jgi:hypothetical protein
MGENEWIQIVHKEKKIQSSNVCGLDEGRTGRIIRVQGVVAPWREGIYPAE